MPRKPAGKNLRQSLEEVCLEKGMRMTEQRRVIARVIEAATDHPDVEELHRRAAAVDARISIATVYRTVKLFEDLGVIARHDFRAGRSRYETIPDEHHDHLIDLRTGEVIEFQNEEIERLQQAIAAKLGFRLVDHRLELYGVPLKEDGGRDKDKP
ncbi:MAG: transcriptional repressor [Rhizobiales bacterium]|nr:transcriptional repressor [Hyphomicrobiales bacterium]MBN9010372.1 transcriptional repressor [Hyphomicrobiales bacterium]